MNKLDVYQMVTDKIVAQLEQGIIPWHKPWSGTLDGAFNRITKKPYSLLNQMMLSQTGEYASFKQWVDLGGKIKKGAKSEIVVFWSTYPISKKTKDEDGNELVEVSNIPILKYYNVFHISQVEGIEPLNIGEEIKHNPIEKAEEIINNYSIKDNLTINRQYSSDRAFYSPALDYVQVPAMEQYQNIEEYYSTLFHELTHSTGAKSRLDRGLNEVHSFGDEVYSKEELVAEIGSANMMNYLGISTDKCFKNSVAYIQSWLRALKNDKKLIVSASSKAQKATDYILKFTEE